MAKRRVFSIREMICPCFLKLKLKCAKSPIPVDVGHSNKFWDTFLAFDSSSNIGSIYPLHPS